MVSNIRYGVCIKPHEYGASNTDIVLLRTLVFNLTLVDLHNDTLSTLTIMTLLQQ